MAILFIGNLPFDASDDLLKEWVRVQGFEVEAADIIRDRFTKHSRGFGLVTLKDDRQMQDAIARLNGKLMAGRSLTVHQAAPLLSVLSVGTGQIRA